MTFTKKLNLLLKILKIQLIEWELMLKKEIRLREIESNVKQEK